VAQNCGWGVDKVRDIVSDSPLLAVIGVYLNTLVLDAKNGTSQAKCCLSEGEQHARLVLHPAKAVRSVE
jgi:hypothetical protein